MAQFGTVQRLIMDQVAMAPAGSDEVFDLRGLARESTHTPASRSRAVHRLVQRGVLQSLVRTGDGFRTGDGWQGQIRYVRRAGGL